MKKIKSILLIIIVYLSFSGSASPDRSNRFVYQSERQIPVVQSVDVVIIGGTTAAVSAAVSAAGEGADVFLVAPKPYLGEDMCATLRLELKKERPLVSRIEQQLFGERTRVTPLEVKSLLNRSLTDAGVKFVFGSYVTEVLRDNRGNPAGVVMANRAGRQAVLAKVIIDATDRAWVCRMAGASTRITGDQEIEFKRMVIIPGTDDQNPVFVEHALNIPMDTMNYAALALAEQLAREKTYTPGQLRASESLFYNPPDRVLCLSGEENHNSNGMPHTDWFRVSGISNMYVLSGCAGISDEMAGVLLEPAAMTGIAEQIGAKAAREAEALPTVNPAVRKLPMGALNREGDIREMLQGLRPAEDAGSYVTLPEMPIPVLAEYDVVVVGGGTSGAAAAIGAGYYGMKVLVVEYLEGLGGIGTLGMIGKPWHGKKIGFAAEVPFPTDNIEPKMEWYRSKTRKLGGNIWLGALGCGAYVEGQTVRGVVVATPEGRGVVRAGVVIDATGSADIAIAAGADYMFGDIESGDLALQGTGYSSRPLRGNYFNSDYLLVDESDMIDVWRTLVSAQIVKASENQYDVVPIIQNRERKRIVGDYVLNYPDQVAGRTFPDVIVISESSYDSHGYPSSPFFALLPHDEKSRKMNQPAPGGICFTPYRCLLPANLEGILVTGLGISMERDASALVRMQFDLANQGYAAGLSAMLAVTGNIQPRDINIRELQKMLIEKGNLPDSVLTMEDSFPLPVSIIEYAVEQYGKSANPSTAGKPLAVILSHKDTALPLVREAFTVAEGRSSLLYAQLLGIWGEKEGNPVLLSELAKMKDWDEKIYQGSMADFAHLPTPVDAIILALGYSGDRSVLPVLLQWLDKLDQEVTLSHHRSLALVLEHLADPAAAEPLARLLGKPGMRGFAMLNLEDASTELDNDGKGPNPVRNGSYEKRTRAIREILLARALYRCGDYNNMGKSILESYRNDMQGLFARHVRQIL